MSYLIFPNQLFELKYFPKDNQPRTVYLIEEPVLFGFRDKKMNFNKLKLVLHRSSMKYYESYLKKNHIEVNYIEIDDIIKNYNKLTKIIKKSEELITFKLTDYFLEKKIKKAFPDIVFLENPNFLVSEGQLNDYYQKNNVNKLKKYKSVMHSSFFNWIKEEINVLKDTKSYDNENRNALPDNIKIPSLGALKSEDKNFIKEGIEYITNHHLLKDNCGPEELNFDNCWFPVTHSGSNVWLKKFIKDRLDSFGDYQDAIRTDNRTLFHSLIAPMFNVGLLSPHQIIEEVMKVNKKIKMNNIEGFLRQIIGWREYQRYCYLHYYDEMTKPNVFGNNRKLSKSLYNGTTGIPPVDDAIRDAFNYGYLHHIQRLMVISNFFNLINLDPDESYKWFMEFSLDSYDWLMIQNVYSMGMWADGGLTMRKPYISTGLYILKMSNYKQPRESEIIETGFNWLDIWKSLFYIKIKSNVEIFKKTPYIFQLKIWDKMSKDDKDDLINISNSFLDKIYNNKIIHIEKK